MIDDCTPEMIKEMHRRCKYHDHPVIGICGYAGAGKDATALILHRYAGYSRLSFADPLREALLALDPLIPSTMGHQRYSVYLKMVGYEQAKKNPEVRRLLQNLGTEVGRKILGNNIWVDALRERVRATPTPVVIPDVRFDNEAALIRELGGQVWLVKRPNVGPVNNHESENLPATVQADRVIDNTSTLHHLERVVLEQLHHLEVAA